MRIVDPGERLDVENAMRRRHQRVERAKMLPRRNSSSGGRRQASDKAWSEVGGAPRQSKTIQRVLVGSVAARRWRSCPRKGAKDACFRTPDLTQKIFLHIPNVFFTQNIDIAVRKLGLEARDMAVDVFGRQRRLVLVVGVEEIGIGQDLDDIGSASEAAAPPDSRAVSPFCGSRNA